MLDIVVVDLYIYKEFSFTFQQVDVIYEPADNMLSEREKLNENHTHFLLVDNGTRKKYGIERNFRVKLERFLCNPCEFLCNPLWAKQSYLDEFARHMKESITLINNVFIW